MSAVVPIAEVHDSETLLDAIRVRKAQLGLSNDALEQLAGLCEGHLSKVLPNPPRKGIGWATLSLLLPALGSKLLLVEDEIAMQRIRPRIKPRDECRVRRKVDTMSNSQPRYRATEDNTNFGIGFYRKGQEFNHLGWPKVFSGGIEAANEAATRVMQWWSRFRLDAQCPPTPWNAEHDRIFLPHHLPPDFRSTRQPALPRVEIEGMPRYRATWQQNFGGREVSIGDEVSYCGWPKNGLEPINDEARQVAAYYETHRDHPKLTSAPWCDFAQELFLPELPEPKRGPGSADGYARDLSIARDPWLEQATRARIMNASEQLNRPPPAPRQRGSRRRVTA